MFSCFNLRVDVVILLDPAVVATLVTKYYQGTNWQGITRTNLQFSIVAGFTVGFISKEHLVAITGAIVTSDHVDLRCAVWLAYHA